MLSRKLVAAVLRVVICLPPTLTLYIYIYNIVDSGLIDMGTWSDTLPVRQE